MRSFSDSSGQVWQADVMDASYGSMLMLFWRLGSFEVYKCPLLSGNHLAAEREVAALSETELCAKLKTAEPWS